MNEYTFVPVASGEPVTRLYLTHDEFIQTAIAMLGCKRENLVYMDVRKNVLVFSDASRCEINEKAHKDHGLLLRGPYMLAPCEARV
jgi:hypothetical protein